MICTPSDLPRLISTTIPTGRVSETAADALAVLLLEAADADALPAEQLPGDGGQG